MEIRILGDFDFAREIISGVARLFSYGNGFGYASGILLVLYLLFLILKHAHDSERSPNPIKEFVFGLVLFLLVGGGAASAKFDVELISISDPSRFEVINDVPALAAVPAWLTSNFLGILREKMENEFTPVTYTAERGLDPLGALIRLYERKIPTTVFEGPDEDYVRSMHEYVENCYLADQYLDRAAPTTTIADLKKINMAKEDSLIDALKVEYNGLFTNSYLGSNLRQPGEQYGERVACSEAWTRLKSPISKLNNSSGSQEIETMIFNSEVEQYSVQAALRMVAGAYSSENSPYALQANLSLAYLVEQGVQRAGYGSEAHRMVFEGYTKAVAQKVGEASIFTKFMVPTTTALETFSFYIAPILMMLAIMGGVGFSYIAKYLGLVLYINLFSFVKVFVDVFTAISVERAFADRQGTPLSFELLPASMEEITGFLATSATLTTSIPLLAMFLLYGSAMTLSGAVKSMGGGNVNGNVLAPEVGTTMNGGTAQAGNTTVQYDANTGAPVQGFSSQSHGSAPSIQFSEILSAAGGATMTSAQSASKEMRNQALESLGQVISEAAKSSTGEIGSDTTSSTSQKMWQAVANQIQAVQSATNWSTAEATDFVVSGYMGIGTDAKDNGGGDPVKDAGGKGNKGTDALGVPLSIKQQESGKLEELAKKAFSGGSPLTKLLGEGLKLIGGEIGGRATTSWGTKDAESISKAYSAIQQYQESYGKSEQYAEMVQNGKTWNAGTEAANTNSYQDMKAKLKSYAESEQLSESVQNNVQKSGSMTQGGSIDVNSIAQGVNNRPELLGSVVEGLANRFTDMIKNDNSDSGGGIGNIESRLNSLGINTRNSSGVSVDSGSLYQAINDRSSTSLAGGFSLMSGMAELSKVLNQSDGNNVKQSLADTAINAGMWGSLGDTLSSAGFGSSLVDPVRQLSNSLQSINSNVAAVGDYQNQATELKGRSPAGEVPLGISGMVETYNGIVSAARDNLDETAIGADRNSDIREADKPMSPQRLTDVLRDASEVERKATGENQAVGEDTAQQGKSGEFTITPSGAQARPESLTFEGQDRYASEVERKATGENQAVGEDTDQQGKSGEFTITPGGAQARPESLTFEGQDLTYENGRFDGLKANDEVMLGNTSYQLTNETQKDDDGVTHQVFKSGDGDARYMWNDNSRRMDMIQRD
jgi:hypothetical protein